MSSDRVAKLSAVVSGHKSGTVLCTVGYIKRGKGTSGMFDPVL